MSTPTAASEELKDLYRELILDHSRRPRHFGRMEHATHSADGINPLCGDKLRLYLRVDDKQRITASSFEGSGCAISMASASLLTDTIVGLPVGDAEACFEVVTRRLADGVEADAPGVDLDKLRALEGVRQFPSRVKCATLAWHALHSALHDQADAVTTE